LRSGQELAAKAMSMHDIGVLAAATAFGKTVIAARLIADRAVNTLVLVHRRQLLDQWVAQLAEFLDRGPGDIGQIGSGRRNITNFIDIALIQSLFRKGKVDDIVGNYGHLIVDECHHIPAHSFEQVARRCKAKYVLGLSATVTRKDGHHPIIFMQCGPVRYRVTAKQGAKMHPFEHRVIFRETKFKMALIPINKKLTIHAVYNALIDDHARNMLIFKDVMKSIVEEKRSPILITERRDHLKVFAEKFRPLVKNVIVLFGGMGQKQRNGLYEKIKSIPDGEERLLIATGKYLGEGFDDARLDTLFLTMPISWKGTLAQYAGRLHRIHYNKREVRIYDYVDSRVPMLVRMHKRRLRGYRAIGYDIG
jgi:superfamily II DNA or RNA helicase